MACETDETIFQSCCEKLNDLKISDVSALSHLIDQINSLNIQNIHVKTETAENLIFQIIPQIPYGNDHLLTKFCSLIFLFLNKQERLLSPNCAVKLAEFLITSLRHCGDCFLSDVLISFSALLSDNGNKIQQFYQDLLGKDGLLFKFIQPNKYDKNVQYYAFQCIFNLLSKNTVSFLQKEYFKIGYDQYIAVIKTTIEQHSSDILSVKILISSLKCLHLLLGSKQMLEDNVGELLGTLKCLLFYGLPGPTLSDFILHPTLPSPDIKLTEDSQCESDSTTYPRLRKLKRVRRTKQKRDSHKKDPVRHKDIRKIDYYDEKPNNFSPYSPSSSRAFPDLKIKSSSSDSEYSDVESSSRIKSHQASVRQIAYQVLQSVVKNTDKKIIFGYWTSFLPDHPAIPGMAYGQNIFTSILKDPVPQVRLGALVLLTEMLRGSKHFLSFADGRSSRHSSFTSLSTVIATIISELHRCLLLALLSENSSLLLTQILKCHAVLCENTPYCKLNDEIILKLLKHLKGFLYHKDSQVQVAALIVFQFIVKSDQIPDEIGNIIISDDFDLAVSNFNQASAKKNLAENMVDNNPWLVHICRKNIFSEEPLPTRIESIQLLSCIVGKYFHKMYCIVSVLEEVILFCLDNSDVSLQLHGAKLLDVFGRCVFNTIESRMTNEQHSSVKQLWQKVIKGPFLRNVTDSQKSLLSVCCDCLSTVPTDVFEKLPEKQQFFYITVLLGLATDSHSNVRGAAVRCLGVYCLFPKLSKDFSFLSDVSEILVKSVDDPYMNVRFKAAWSLGKLSDALFENNNLCIRDHISEGFFYSTGMACVEYSKDGDKVRANSIRALGIFLHHLPESLIGSPKMTHFVKSACSVLQSALSSNSMKVCWNACYAFSKLLKNTKLIDRNVIFVADIFTPLMDALKSPNFKVRISASHALTVVRSRDTYAMHFLAIWLELLEALYSASKDVNFKEIKHQENLLHQLCFSLCRLMTMLTFTDAEAIGPQTLDASEMLLTTMWKFGSQLSSDKIDDITMAVENLNVLCAERDLQVLFFLREIVNQVTTAFYGQEISEMLDYD